MVGVAIDEICVKGISYVLCHVICYVVYREIRSYVSWHAACEDWWRS